MASNVASRLLPLVLALGWLPAGILLSALLRQQIPPLTAWLSLWPTAVAGLPLAGATWRLQRLGHSRVARWLMVLLGTATVPVALVAGLLGPVAIVVATGVVSLPAWLVVLVVRWRIVPFSKACPRGANDTNGTK